MTLDELKLKIANIVSNYGFVYEGIVNDHYGWEYDHKFLKYTLKLSEIAPGKPDSFVEIKVDNPKEKVVIYYRSITSNYAPSGVHSVTSKPYEFVRKIKNFNFEVLEQWASCQKDIYNEFYKELKLKKINENLKNIEKDF